LEEQCKDLHIVTIGRESARDVHRKHCEKVKANLPLADGYLRVSFEDLSESAKRGAQVARNKAHNESLEALEKEYKDLFHISILANEYEDQVGDVKKNREPKGTVEFAEEPFT